MPQSLLWTCLANRIAALFIFVNEDGQEFRKLLFFRRCVLTFIQVSELFSHKCEFLICADDAGKCSLQEERIRILVNIRFCNSHGSSLLDAPPFTLVNGRITATYPGEVSEGLRA